MEGYHLKQRLIVSSTTTMLISNPDIDPHSTQTHYEILKKVYNLTRFQLRLTAESVPQDPRNDLSNANANK